MLKWNRTALTVDKVWFSVACARCACFWFWWCWFCTRFSRSAKCQWKCFAHKIDSHFSTKCCCWMWSMRSTHMSNASKYIIKFYGLHFVNGCELCRALLTCVSWMFRLRRRMKLFKMKMSVNVFEMLSFAKKCLHELNNVVVVIVIMFRRWWFKIKLCPFCFIIG